MRPEKDPTFGLRPGEALEYRLLHLLISGCRVGVAGGINHAPVSTVDRLVEEVAKRDADVARAIILHSRPRTDSPIHVAAAVASMATHRRGVRSFRDLFFRSILDVDDLLWFLSYAMKGERPTRLVEEYVAQWIELRLTDAEAVAHRRLRPGHDVSLRDAIVMTHPTFRGEDCPRIRYVLGGEPGDGDPPVMEAVWRFRMADDSAGVRRALEIAPIPWSIASAKVGRDPDLWLAALPGMGLDDVLLTLPGQADVEPFSGERLAAVLARVDELSGVDGAVPIVEAVWRLTWPKDKELMGGLVEVAARAASRVDPPSGGVVRAVDRCGSAPSAFVAASIAAFAFPSPGPTVAFDDVVEALSEGSPVEVLRRRLGDVRPRGGYRPEIVPQIVASEVETPGALIVSLHDAEAGGSGFAHEAAKMRVRFPQLRVVRVLHRRIPAPPGEGLLDRVVSGPGALSRYLPLLADPVGLVEAARKEIR